MKILFITRKYPPQVGGMEELSFNLTTMIRCPKKIIALGLPKIHLLWFLPMALIKGWLSAKDYDLIHLGDLVLSPIGFFIKKFVHKQIVVTVHGLDLTYDNFFYQRYLRLFAYNFDKYICISRAVEEKAIKAGLTNTIVISVGVNSINQPPISRRRSVMAKLQKKLCTNFTNRFIVLTIGRLVERKGHAWFIENVVPKLPSDIIYLIAGDGKEKNSLSSLIKTKGLTDKVFLLGSVSSSEKRVLLYDSDVFVMPNIKVKGDFEGFGIVALEAAFCGLPVVASNLEGLKDAVTEGKNGLLVKSKDSKEWIKTIIQLHAKKSSLKPLGQRSKKYTTMNFGWKKIVDNYREEFSRTLQKPRMCVVLSFDDCYQETLKYTLPILRKFNMPGTYAVPAGLIGKKLDGFQVATKGQLWRASRLGMEIASHSLSHVSLSRKGRMTKLWRAFMAKHNKHKYVFKGTRDYLGGFFSGNYQPNEKFVQREIADSKNLLISQGFSVNSFVYPGGAHDDQTKIIAKNYYQSARLTDPGFNQLETVDLYKLKAFLWDTKTTVETANGWIDRAEKDGLCLIETFHLVSKGNPRNYEYYTSYTDFRNHLKYIKKNGIPVVTQGGLASLI